MASASTSIACDVLGAVERELDRLQAAATADVEAAPAASDLLAEQVAPHQERALRGNEGASLRDEVGEGQRVQRAPGRVDPRLGRRHADAAEHVGPPFVATRRPWPRPGQRGTCRADLFGPDAAAAPDELGALLAPAQRHARELGGAGVVVDVPAVAREVAEARVDSERQVREVA